MLEKSVEKLSIQQNICRKSLLNPPQILDIASKAPSSTPDRPLDKDEKTKEKYKDK